jgi:hypothetical protein
VGVMVCEEVPGCENALKKPDGSAQDAPLLLKSLARLPQYFLAFGPELWATTTFFGYLSSQCIW